MKQRRRHEGPFAINKRDYCATIQTLYVRNWSNIGRCHSLYYVDFKPIRPYGCLQI